MNPVITKERANDSFDAAPLQPDHLTVTLQPGLMVCHTFAESLDAVSSVKTFPGDCEFIHLNCQLDGNFEGCVGGRRMAYSKGDITLGYSAGECFTVQHCPRFRNLAVMVTPQVLGELAGHDLPPALGEGRDLGFFVRCAGTCRKTVRSALNITSLLAETPRQRLLLHAATLDFLHWHLSAFLGYDEGKPLTPREHRQLEEARDLLMKDLSAPPTIAELARAVGMNQCKLKAGFKKLFGSSIYALFQEERMNRAQELLQLHNVTETAVILGYTNISHFSSAFQKQFGFLPSRVRQQTFGGLPARQFDAA
ncbi:MAG: helix-turn-helix domain-containing protein [Rhodocyclaceae bacterium]